MFDELVGQARRLFSSKSNGGKQVSQLADRLHSYKQVLLAISTVLLLGYSQFREHFKCQGNGDFDSNTATSFCLLNGTTTVITHNGSEADPHTGLGFQTTSDDKVINHSYMRNYWYLLILLIVFSHLAQRMWASIFQDDMLKAILQLVGSAELRQVRAAEEAKPYEMLSSLSSDLSQEIKRQVVELPKNGEISRNELVARRIALVDEYVNIYDHTLDYYPNQLTYLLLTRKTASYKLSSLKMRRKLIIHFMMSTLITIAQFIFAMVVFGNEFLLFGWRYLIAAVIYMRNQFTTDSSPLNSIDYELSSSLFPINSACRFKQYAPSGGLETIVVQCTIPINELGSKLFVFIWWILVISIAVEIWSLITIVLCSLHFKTISWAFGHRFWPAAREQADLIATFRHKRSDLLRRRELIKKLRQSSPLENQVHLITNSKPSSCKPNDENIGSKKKLECDLSYGLDDSCRSDRQSTKKWYLWCPQDICVGLGNFASRWICCRASKRLDRLEREAEKDINIYYLLYLLYLRLGESRSKVEEVIKMTACALLNYLNEFEAQCEDFQMARRSEDLGEDTDEYNSLDKDDHVLKMC